MTETLRLFAALLPSTEAVEHLDDFLAPRRDADPDLRWSAPHQWHLTTAFAAAVPEYLVDDLGERLAAAASRHAVGELALAGGGAFPDPDRARVLWTPPVAPAAQLDELARLARACRTAFATAGAEVEGQRFSAHVTLARLARPRPVMRWLRVLEAYAGPMWPADELTLIASHLGEGPRRAPRYETLASFPLAIG